jgi:CRISPR/Cas system-associated protein Cas5 (RAMP superfamily)
MIYSFVLSNFCHIQIDGLHCQEYNPEWLLPPESEIAGWHRASGRLYPDSGEPGYVIIKKFDISSEWATLEKLVGDLEATKKNQNVEKIAPWTKDFR